MLGILAGRRIRLAASALTLAALAVPASPASAAEVTCDRVAAPTGSDSAAGTLAAPYRTAQKLADALAAGQTGCLRAGTYTQTPGVANLLRLNHGGASGAPLTIRSFPGERATLQGVTYVPHNSDFVTLSDLDFVGTDDNADTSDAPVSIQIMAADTQVLRSVITNNRLRSCMILGNMGGYGQAARTLVAGNVFHHCGSPANGMHDHAIYTENAVDVEITENVFHDNEAWAVQLWPNADRVRIHHNVMDRNGGGVILAGSSSSASDDDVIENNVITNSLRDYNVTIYWGGTPGTGNAIQNNCVANGYKGNVQSSSSVVRTGNLSADPLYVDAAAGDYRLAAGSPCLALLGYDVAAKIAGLAPVAADPTPAPTPDPTPDPAPSADPTPDPAPVATEPVNAAPSVSIVSPASGGSFTDRLRVQAAASDDQRVARVELWVDGVLRATDTAAAWSFDWKVPRKLAAGAHTVTVKAFDAAGLSASASTTVKRVTSTRLARTASLKTLISRCADRRGGAKRRCVRRARAAAARVR